MSNRFLLCRFTHRAGRLAGKSNDWAIAVIGDAIEIRAGKSDGFLARRPLLRTSWSTTTAQDEADKRLREQLRQSYEIVGHCSFTADGLVCDVSPMVDGFDAGVPVNVLVDEHRRLTPPALFWSVRADSWDAAMSVMEEVAGANANAAPKLDLRWTGRNGLVTNVPIVDGYVIAFAGYNGSGPLRWDGEVPSGSPVSVLLWILLFRQRARDQTVRVTVADAAGNEITGLRLAERLGVLRELGGADLDAVRPLALSLGLISAGLDGISSGRMKRFTFS